MSEISKELISSIVEVNAIVESLQNKFTWVFYTFDESQKHQLVYVRFSEADFLSATQKCSNCTSVFADYLMENGTIERISEQNSSFESYCNELLSLESDSIYWGRADYSAMFYNLTTSIFKKGRD